MIYLRLGDRDISALDLATITTLGFVLRWSCGPAVSLWWVAALPIWYVLLPWLVELLLLLVAAVLLLGFVALHDLWDAITRAWRNFRTRP